MPCGDPGVETRRGGARGGPGEAGRSDPCLGGDMCALGAGILAGGAPGLDS